ncbi:hypothetical protein P7C70_g944, partial [Phenoliferia sp. Uapishka_3]
MSPRTSTGTIEYDTAPEVTGNLTIFDDTGSSIIWGGDWSLIKGAHYYGQSAHRSITPGSHADILFFGTNVEILGTTWLLGGVIYCTLLDQASFTELLKSMNISSHLSRKVEIGVVGYSHVGKQDLVKAYGEALLGLAGHPNSTFKFFAEVRFTEITIHPNAIPPATLAKSDILLVVISTQNGQDISVEQLLEIERQISVARPAFRTPIILASTQEDFASAGYRTNNGRLSDRRFRYFAAVVAQIFEGQSGSRASKTSFSIARTADVPWHLGRWQLMKQISRAAQEFGTHVDLEDKVLKCMAARGPAVSHYRLLVPPKRSLEIPGWTSGPDQWMSSLSVEHGCLSNEDLLANLEDRKSGIDLTLLVATLFAGIQASLIQTYTAATGGRMAVKASLQRVS